ncbi:MAG: polymer-forming cytoskeletal protein [Rhizobiales bacterium]|nr:polymer-forming cytoskeletal protein [Hyphomicrobiales bacterium]
MAAKLDALNAVDFNSDGSATGPELEGCAIIGEGVTFSGSIVVPGKLVVYGTMEGGDSEARELLVGRTGLVSGKVRVDVAEVHGRVVEHIEAKVRLSVRKTGSVEGTASYGEIEVEKGGKLAGNISAIGTSEER